MDSQYLLKTIIEVLTLLEISLPNSGVGHSVITWHWCTKVVTKVVIESAESISGVREVLDSL